MHITKQLVSDCKETESATHWKWACIFRTRQDENDANDKGQTKSLFVSGGNSAECTEKGPDHQVHCQLKAWGTAKEQKIFGFGISATGVAVLGSGFTLHDSGLLIEMINQGESAQEAKSEYPRSLLRQIVDRLVDEDKRKIESIASRGTAHITADLKAGGGSFKIEQR
jgi:hypothetical protein